MSGDQDLWRLTAAVNADEPRLVRASDQDLSRLARDLRRRARAGQPLDELLVPAFALVREAARRTLGQRPFDVQIAGGVALFRGRVVEMPTGEGKTLAGVAPAFLRSLPGDGAHVLTFNDYLARRDAEWMGPVYRSLDARVGCVQEGMSAVERRRAYSSEVTYLTAKEAGFDLLRDGLCLESGDQVLRGLCFALVDEADSILIDEARIPLVIAGAVDARTGDLARLARVVRGLEAGVDFDTDEYARNIFLTEAGASRVEAALACGSLFDPERQELQAAVRNALHAEFLLHRDVDYIVRDGTVELVDELTGRVAENRQWPDGLQAAVEAKQGLRLRSDGRILASTTLYHFFERYPHLCGMTATASSAAEELRELYGLEVSVIPPHRPCVRVDRPDAIYARRDARDRAVVEEIRRVHASGRPILVGTVSVADSERLASALARCGVDCRVLNAKNDEQEAAIVAEAGGLGAVTISTNMAGRGTDIRLGGRDEQDRRQVVALGGLYVIGSRRHESLRIDRQLRGRAGRQGDPGSSRFFVSLEDDLLQRYGIKRLIPRRLFPEGTETPLDSRVVRREVERAQRIVEGQCFDARRRLYQFSEILEHQRLYLADWRQALLEDRAELDLLQVRAPHRWQRLQAAIGDERLHEAERRLTLVSIDRCWSEYLTEMQAVRDEVHLVALDGRTPLAEFFRTAIQAFERLLEEIDQRIVDGFAELEATGGVLDWRRAAPGGPSATWTYMVHDNVFGNNLLGTLANRASIGLWGVLLMWPVLLVWGLIQHWQRRRRGR